MTESSQEKIASGEIDLIETDIVVVGAGGGGLAAGLVAAQGGADVIIVEQLAAPGGLSLFAEGMFAVESSLQRKAYVGLTRDQAFRHHMEATQWVADPRLVRAFFDRSGETIEWLQRQGVEYDEAAAMWPDGPRTWHLIKGGGRGLVKALAKQAQKAGARILLKTAMQEILRTSGGRAAGIIARTRTGKDVEIRAKAVIIAGGGYGSNAAALEQHAGVIPGTPPLVDMGQTGQPIWAAWAAGAAEAGTGALMCLLSVVGEKPDSHLNAAAVQPGLWVNRDGERFCDEAVYFEFTLAANALNRQPGAMMYSLFDEAGKERLIAGGVEAPLGIYVPAATKLERLEADLKRGIERGLAFSGDTPEALADALHIDPVALAKTVDDYNANCDRNRDGAFAKDQSYLRPLRRGPFYAIETRVHVFTSVGGIKINHRTEVVGAEGRVIPGLYAVGNCAGGLYAGNYELTHPGVALAFAVNSGRMAAEGALGLIEE
ncbi:MAG: FAD-dependent oxidoreductase [Thermoleophilia bacterium]|nr:FAD-dependent oxidoreductase [Thermoleophilia bacterium]